MINLPNLQYNLLYISEDTGLPCSNRDSCFPCENDFTCPETCGECDFSVSVYFDFEAPAGGDGTSWETAYNRSVDLGYFPNTTIYVKGNNPDDKYNASLAGACCYKIIGVDGQAEINFHYKHTFYTCCYFTNIKNSTFRYFDNCQFTNCTDENHFIECTNMILDLASRTSNTFTECPNFIYDGALLCLFELCANMDVVNFSDCYFDECNGTFTNCSSEFNQCGGTFTNCGDTFTACSGDFTNCNNTFSGCSGTFDVCFGGFLNCNSCLLTNCTDSYIFGGNTFTCTDCAFVANNTHNPVNNSVYGLNGGAFTACGFTGTSGNDNVDGIGSCSFDTDCTFSGGFSAVGSCDYGFFDNCTFDASSNTDLISGDVTNTTFNNIIVSNAGANNGEIYLGDNCIFDGLVVINCVRVVITDQAILNNTVVENINITDTSTAITINVGGPNCSISDCTIALGNISIGQGGLMDNCVITYQGYFGVGTNSSASNCSTVFAPGLGGFGGETGVGFTLGDSPTLTSCHVETAGACAYAYSPGFGYGGAVLTACTFDDECTDPAAAGFFLCNDGDCLDVD